MALHACSNYKKVNSNEIKGLAFAHFSHTVRAENLILLALENNLHLGIPNKPRIVPTTILYLCSVRAKDQKIKQKRWKPRAIYIWNFKMNFQIIVVFDISTCEHTNQMNFNSIRFSIESIEPDLCFSFNSHFSGMRQMCISFVHLNE